LNFNWVPARECYGDFLVLAFFTEFSFYLYWVIYFFIQPILYFLMHLTRNKKQNKNNPTKMVPRTKRTPKTAKAKTNTNPASTKKSKAKTANTTTNATTDTKKGGRHPEDKSFFDHFGDICKYRGKQGTVKVPRDNAGNNQHLAD
jgi:hypothetical protein